MKAFFPCVRPDCASGRSPGCGAFTLTEMLLAIAIVGSLAAMLVPAVGMMQRKAAMAADLNNLSRIGTALSAFAAENGGRVPNNSLPIAGTSSGPGQPDRPSFMESVDRMMAPDRQFNTASIYNWQRRKIWYSKSHAKMPAGQSFPSSQYYWGTAWGMNSFLWNNAAPLNGANAFDGYLNRAPNFSKLVLVGEKNRNGGHEFDPRIAPTFEPDVESNYRISRENKALYLFGDFHVELIEGDQSVIAHPEYRSYSPENRLYYAW